MLKSCVGNVVSALVLDLIPNRDGPTEGRLVRAAMENMGWDVKLIEKPRKDQALEALYHGWRANVIHVSAHGLSSSLSTSHGRIGFSDIRERFRRSLADDDTWLDDTQLMINSSCRGASRAWRHFVLEELGIHNYIAPEGSPTLVEGIVFPVGFYFELWGRNLTRRSVVRAYREAFGRYFSSAPWQLFPTPEPEAKKSRRYRRSLSDF